MQFDDLERMAAHDAEIRQSRIGRLGGSDAAWLLSLNDLQVPRTTMQRIRVLLGLDEPQVFETPYTNAGHMFEDYAEQKILPIEHKPKDGANISREVLLGKKRPFRFFRVQAHADFMTDTGTVYECKYVTKKNTQQVMQQYMAQLQWYYWMGARRVYLIHGRGCADPFYVLQHTIIYVPKIRSYTRAFRMACHRLERVCAEIAENDARYTPVLQTPLCK